jgi:peroxiredoxin
MNTKTLFASLAVCGTLICGAVIAQPADPKHDHKHDGKEHAAAGLKLGEVAPTFSAMDTDGKKIDLADLKGKVVVLQWYNPECPAVKQHYEDGANTFNAMYDTYHAKGVEFIAINSGAKGMQGNGADLNATSKKNWKIAYPIVMDEAGTIGKSYSATNTPHMYIINAEGKLAYMGAIDNGTFGKNGDKNYVAMALDEILKGTTVTTPETKAYGCSVKYAKKK